MYPEPLLLNLLRQPNISSERTNMRRFYLRYKSEMRQEFCPRSVVRSFVRPSQSLCIYKFFFFLFFSFQLSKAHVFFVSSCSHNVRFDCCSNRFNCANIWTFSRLAICIAVCLTTAYYIHIVTAIFLKMIRISQRQRRKDTGKYSMAKRCSNSLCVRAMVILANILKWS